ncbi:MAG TPA: hypothetical protein VGD78_11080 [Chthoniobacterales bacterium]
MLRAQNSAGDISRELDKETDLQTQVQKVLDPVGDAVKQTTDQARLTSGKSASSAPADEQSRQLYQHAQTGFSKLRTVLVTDLEAFDRAKPANDQPGKDAVHALNDALQAFYDHAAMPGQPAPRLSQDLSRQLQDIYFVHTAGLTRDATAAIRGRIIQQVESRVALPAFGAGSRR